MATEAEILSKLIDLLDRIASVLDGAGASKLVTLDRATPADAALVYLRENGDEKFRWGMPGGEDDFVIQRSPDGSALTYEDVFRIDAETGAITITGLAMDTVDINGGAIDGAAIGATTPSTGAFTSIAMTGDLAYSDVDWRVYAGTVDGADTSRLALLAGGAFSTNRGAYAYLCGNEHATTPGEAVLAAGNVSGAVTKISAPGYVSIAAPSTIIAPSSSGRAWSPTGGVSDLLVERAGNAGVSIIGAAASASSLNFGDVDDENAGFITYYHSSDAMAFRTGGVGEAMRIDSAGRLIIGGTGGIYPLDVYGNIRARDALLVGIGTGTAGGDDNLIKPAASSAYLNLKGGAGRAKMLLANDFINLVAGNVNGKISFMIGADTSTAVGSEIASFDASGFSLRDTQGDDDVRMTLYPNGSTYSQLGASSTISFIDSGGARPFVVYTNGSERSRMTENGALLIGTSVSGASKLVVNDDSIQINTPKTPASASDTGTAGQIAWDDDHIYVCTATDTWKRAALSTW